MAVTRRHVLVVAFLVTLVLFLSIMLFGDYLDSQREQYINQEVQKMYNNINEIQTFSLMSDTYGDEMACLSFRSKLRELDQSIWNLGVKLDQYRTASEEFVSDDFYREQKRIFNENEVIYMMLLRRLQQQCAYDDKVIVSFYYQNSEDCGKCDDQSFILSDINREIPEEVSIFSFDTQLGLTTIDLLTEYYDIEQYPCTVVNEEVFCGVRGKDFLMQKICSSMTNVSACEGY